MKLELFHIATVALVLANVALIVAAFGGYLS